MCALRKRVACALRCAARGAHEGYRLGQIVDELPVDEDGAAVGDDLGDLNAIGRVGRQGIRNAHLHALVMHAGAHALARARRVRACGEARACVRRRACMRRVRALAFIRSFSAASISETCESPDTRTRVPYLRQAASGTWQQCNVRRGTFYKHATL